MPISTMDTNIHISNTEFNSTSTIKNIVSTTKDDNAFYVCNIGDIVAKYKKWTEQLPRVEPFYAVKCNDAQTVVATLAALGSSFDCATHGEMSQILQLGVDKSRIIFANPTKQISHVHYAKAHDVDLMTFDGTSELYKIKTHFPDSKLVLRIRFDDEQADVPLGVKYGCDPVLEAPEILKLAHSLNVAVVGIAFHVGTGCTNPITFYNAIQASHKLFNYVEQELDYKMTLLDVGGGYPGELNSKFDKIAYHINRGLDDYFPNDNIRIIAEPGRFFVASAFTLVCNVYASRLTTVNSTNHTMYYVNDGLYGSFNGLHYTEDQVVPKLLSTYSGDVHRSSIWGPTLDSADMLFRNIMLPQINVGDWILFENMGAYSVTIFSTFNAIPKPKIHWFVNQSAWDILEGTNKCL